MNLVLKAATGEMLGAEAPANVSPKITHESIRMTNMIMKSER